MFAIGNVFVRDSKNGIDIIQLEPFLPRAIVPRPDQHRHQQPADE
jgi:hypothetical protein